MDCLLTHRVKISSLYFPTMVNKHKVQKLVKLSQLKYEFYKAVPKSQFLLWGVLFSNKLTRIIYRNNLKRVQSDWKWFG